MYKFRLYLYVTGVASKSIEDAWNFKAILDEKLKGRYSLEVINVLDNPHRAEEDNILATPTLVKVSPPPEKRVVGDLSDKETVLLALGLIPQEENK